MEQVLANEMIQFGFAGFAFVLLGFIFYLIKSVVQVAKESTTAIMNNTRVVDSTIAHINALNQKTDVIVEKVDDTNRRLENIAMKLASNPCLLRKREGDDQ